MTWPDVSMEFKKGTDKHRYFWGEKNYQDLFAKINNILLSAHWIYTKYFSDVRITFIEHCIWLPHEKNTFAIKNVYYVTCFMLIKPQATLVHTKRDNNGTHKFYWVVVFGLFAYGFCNKARTPFEHDVSHRECVKPKGHSRSKISPSKCMQFEAQDLRLSPVADLRRFVVYLFTQIWLVIG